MNKNLPKVRFAPSPTGFLHLGNIRTALLNWLFADRWGGEFLLRLDDTDRKRSEERFTQALFEDLMWMGLNWSSLERQSDRTSLYETYILALKQKGRLYPCYETPQELEIKRRLQLSRGRPPLYDRTALQLSSQERSRLEAQGRAPHWRFLLDPEEIMWEDLIRGPLKYNLQSLSDPIVIREDNTISFLLAGAIDDIDLGITHILRGEDHITNTAVQIQMMKTLSAGNNPLSLGHFSLITDAHGQGFSKRLGSLSLQELRAQGMLPLAISSFLMALGTSEAPSLVTHLKQLSSLFDLSHFGRATPKLDIDDLWRLHEKFLHHLSFEEAEKLCQEHDIQGLTPPFWEALRDSLRRLEDITEWQKICKGDLESLPLSDTLTSLPPSFWETAHALLPQEPWGEDTWKQWTQSLKEKTGLSGKALFHPLREKLTGRSTGPEMKKLLPLMMPEKVLQRLIASPQI
jgi:glutamyl-tRNA synthetase